MPDSWPPAPSHSNPCDFCSSRGWGIREGFVRRCEVCCRFRDDHAARHAANPELARFALRELPTAHIPPDTGAMRCPWCNHLPTNEDIDTFWQVGDATTHARARIGRPPPGRCGDEDPDELWLLLGEENLDEGSSAHGKPRLLCPNPACRKTFTAAEELDFDSDPEEKVWNGRKWVRASATPVSTGGRS
jgi:hypothetical protein